jgi:hypothetical protein
MNKQMLAKKWVYSARMIERQFSNLTEAMAA